METINDIHKWLRSSKDYKSGVEIIIRVDPTFSKLYLLQGPENSYSKSVLEKRLRELAESMPEKIEKPQVRKFTEKAVVIDHSKRDYKTLPPDLQLKYSRSGQILSEANYIKGQLLGKPQKERPILIAKIMDLYNERRIIWNQIDEFFGQKNTKKEENPKPKPKRGMAPESDDIDVKIKRLKQNISKNKHRVDRKIEVDEWQRKLEYLRWEKQAQKNALKR
jgi:hypothetical protein